VLCAAADEVEDPVLWNAAPVLLADALLEPLALALVLALVDMDPVELPEVVEAELPKVEEAEPVDEELPDAVEEAVFVLLAEEREEVGVAEAPREMSEVLYATVFELSITKYGV